MIKTYTHSANYRYSPLSMCEPEGCLCEPSCAARGHLWYIERDKGRGTGAGEHQHAAQHSTAPLANSSRCAPPQCIHARLARSGPSGLCGGSLFAKSKGAKRGRESCEDELTHKRAHNGQTHCDDMGKLNRQKTQLCNGYSFTVTLQSGQL